MRDEFMEVRFSMIKIQILNAKIETIAKNISDFSSIFYLKHFSGLMCPICDKTRDPIHLY